MSRVSAILFVLLLALTANFLQFDCAVADTNTVCQAQEFDNDYSVQPSVAKLPEPLLRWENLLQDAQIERPEDHLGYPVVKVIPPPDDEAHKTSTLSRRGPPAKLLNS